MSAADVHLRLNDADAAALDALRGALGRPAALRRLIREAVPTEAAPASYADALAMLTAQAKAGSTAATIALAKLLQADAAKPAKPVDPFLVAKARHADELAARRGA